MVKANIGTLVVALLFLLTSCKKIQEKKIINGTWEVTKVELNHGDGNDLKPPRENPAPTKAAATISDHHGRIV